MAVCSDADGRDARAPRGVGGGGGGDGGGGGGGGGVGRVRKRRNGSNRPGGPRGPHGPRLRGRFAAAAAGDDDGDDDDNDNVDDDAAGRQRRVRLPPSQISSSVSPRGAPTVSMIFSKNLFRRTLFFYQVGTFCFCRTMIYLFCGRCSFVFNFNVFIFYSFGFLEIWLAKLTRFSLAALLIVTDMYRVFLPSFF